MNLKRFSTIMFCMMVVSVLSVVLITCGCKENADVQDVQVVLTGHTSCKGSLDVGKADGTQYSACAQYNYDGQKTLTINHINALLQCCSGDISVKFDYTGNLITIGENQTTSGCYWCLCLYDLQFEVTNLPPGQYRIRFIEPYLNSKDEPLDFTITLTSSPATGTICVERTLLYQEPVK
jgi:hypothetical protein